MKVKIYEYDQETYFGWLIKDDNDFPHKRGEVYKWDIDGNTLDNKQNLTVRDVTLFWNKIIDQTL